MDRGNTAAILNPFLDGMREAGAEVEVYYTKKLNIKPCQGEGNCWHKTPGKCFQKDDMKMLLPKIAEADIQIFATPVFVDGITGPLKNLLDRTVPLALPSFDLRDGHCRHPLRNDTNAGKLVLVSSCGFWEMDNFDPVLAHMKAICRNENREFAGALLRPHGSALKAMANGGHPANDIFEAAREAGHQLVQYGELSRQTLSIVSRPLMTLEAYMLRTNQRYQQEPIIPKGTY